MKKEPFDQIVETLSPQPVQLPEKSFAENELYVFLSYAGRDRAIAEQVRDYLTAAGVRVFLDTKEIRTGNDWVVTIDTALRESQRMVLLLSKASMPYRKEVHLEWMFFDREQKPIYPLYIEDCDLLYRLRVYNYIDARADLPGALQRLVTELRSDFTPPQPITSAERINILKDAESDIATLPEAINALRQAVLDPAGNVVLSEKQANAIKDHKPADLTEFRLGRIAEWSLPRHRLDKRFVNLTLLLDKGESEPQRWHRAEDFRFNDLRDVLDKTQQDRVLVLLGNPGSGKSTLLRRLQLDHSMDCLRDYDTETISFFSQLNGYRASADGKFQDPRDWLNARWAALYPQLPPLETYLRQGKALLLLDALNEMPHKSPEDYHRLVGLWRAFAQEAARQGNHIVFSCRSLDYSAPLSSPDLRVPQIEVLPMNAEQVREFLDAYVAAQPERIWKQLDGSPLFTLYQTPYFLKLLCDQVKVSGDVPAGRAALFTGFIRRSLKDEINGELFQLANGLLNEADYQKINLNRWRNEFELPEDGILFRKLSDLAFTMQQKGLETEGAQVRIDYGDARNVLADAKDEVLLKAGIALKVLDKDVEQNEILFFHQLLQEYFAARQLAKAPNPALVHVEWQADKVKESLADTLAKLADGDPLPPLPQTGWEETTLTAAPMAGAINKTAKDATDFIRNLIEPNLPLAARCAAAPEVRISPELKSELQRRLIERTQDNRADLRARIAAGEALGLIGDPRFELRNGKFGDYLLPPLITIPGGKYTIGDDNGEFDFERPQGEVELPEFQIGQYPVTNAEYKLFMEAGGYEDERWWDTPESLAWLSGEASSDGAKQSARDFRKTLQGLSEGDIRGLVKQNRATSQQVNDWITFRNWTDERYEEQLEEWYPAGKLYRQPEFWDDARFNNPAQPVVGVTWFEACAYCNWLTANATDGLVYRLPTEAEFEAAARGKKGRQFPYGNKFDSSRCNTFESHIRRTSPVGVFNNATPEGAFDLSGNAYTWTLSIYDQDRFPYPYRSDDGREDISATGVRRVLRGGSWFDLQLSARAVARDDFLAANRNLDSGFRVVLARPPSS